MSKCYNVIYIKTLERLRQYTKLLYNDSLWNDKTGTHLIGFDAEFICKKNHPNSLYAHWVKSGGGTNEYVCLIQIATKNNVFLYFESKRQRIRIINENDDEIIFIHFSDSFR